LVRLCIDSSDMGSEDVTDMGPSEDMADTRDPRELMSTSSGMPGMPLDGADMPFWNCFMSSTSSSYLRHSSSSSSVMSMSKSSSASS